MKKVLIISGIPYSQSNRGIDILTGSFHIKGFTVHHLCFPYNREASKVAEPIPGPGFKQFFARKSRFIYYEDYMFFLPKFLTRISAFLTCLTFPEEIKPENYNFIVIESGKPVLLYEKLKNHPGLIYRQSDSVRLIWSKNEYLWDLEDRVIAASKSVLVINDYFKRQIPEKFHNKVTVVKNGFDVPSNFYDKNPYSGKNNCVYFGLFRLDYDTVAYIARTAPDLTLHLIGRGLTSRELKKIRTYPNIRFYGVLKPAEYVRYIKYADVLFVPFKNDKKYTHFGITSKYYIAMNFNLPIISFPIKSVTNNPGITFVSTREEFLEKIRSSLQKKIDYSIDLPSFRKENIIKKYGTFIDSLK